MGVSYDWIVETVTSDEYGDIEDTMYFDNAAAAVAYSREATPTTGCHFEIGLVRDFGNDEDGLLDRQWAYVDDGKLPVEFDGGAKVPARLLKEWNDAR